jgi:hypothetical protein
MSKLETIDQFEAGDLIRSTGNKDVIYEKITDTKIRSTYKRDDDETSWELVPGYEFDGEVWGFGNKVMFYRVIMVKI